MSSSIVRIARAMAAFALALLVATASATAGEVIKSYDAAITLNVDGSIDVVETLAIVVDGTAIKRGIFRDIDTGARAVGLAPAQLTVTRVERDGSAEPYAVEPYDAFARVRIGDADVLVEPGLHTYVVGYHLTNAATLNAGLALLARQAVGRWDFPIESASATLALPPNARVIGVTGSVTADGVTEVVVPLPTEGGLRFTHDATMEPGAIMWIHILVANSMLTKGTAT
jgi:Predicted membrane protein (DUF2207)